ncbi:MAG: hypothetical protein INQ03_16055 [Candidatus Heimdallarchaeota archaeon]|nr:hypothetical protein [Candidatus Heimdallarchaeota archaeon]
MSTRFRLLLITIMTIALGFGFLELFIPNFPYSFKRLHIFLYNLLTGGTILLYFTEGKPYMSNRVKIYFTMALTYTLLAFYEIYLVSIFLGLFMSVLVESFRVQKFGFLPLDFFRSSVPTSKKFHQAALLCLSIGLVICSFAIWNDEYLHLLDFEKLSLNTFFLGFSFPLSLITLSISFNMMHKAKSSLVKQLKTVAFWTITGGVVVFFGFILFENLILELVISLILFVAVGMVLVMYIKIGIKEQQKAFLTSGITFLLVTSLFGVMYILFLVFPNFIDYYQNKVILHYHAMLALYGWNLSGLAVISRFDDFPIMLHEGKTVALHWIVVLGFAPLGYYYKWAAIIAFILYFTFLYILFFSRGTKEIIELVET